LVSDAVEGGVVVALDIPLLFLDCMVSDDVDSGVIVALFESYGFIHVHIVIQMMKK
jgi:hypothetical protein